MTWVRAGCFVALGAAAFAFGPGLASRVQPPITIDFSSDPPSQLTAGFYPVEHTPEGHWFAWTRGVFGLALPSLDRSTPWTVTLRIAASRPDGSTPDLVTNIDGAVRDRFVLPAGGFVERTYTIDPRPGEHGLVIAWTVSPTFVPTGGDARVLGAQVDRLELAPVGASSRGAFNRGPLVLTGVVFGAVMVALGLSWLGGISLIVIAAGAISLVITRGLGPFVTFPYLPIALGAFAAAIATTVALPARTAGGRLVTGVTFLTVVLQLLLLTHPEMPINDAIFQTHRFQDVLGGHYLFASLAPGNYRFPYPIGLYLFARPFAAFAPTTVDRMMLLRVIVVATDAFASALLYRLVMRWRGDELEAVGTVVAYHLLPLGFGVIVTANLTNVFAQSLAMITLVVAGLAIARIASDDKRTAGVAWTSACAIGTLAAAAFLSHTSTFAVLGTQLALAGAWLVVSRRPSWRPAGRTLIVAAIGALVFAVAVYYAYFTDVYREAFTRIAAETGHATAAAGGRTPLTRLTELPRGLNVAFGLPAMIIAVVGAIRIARDGPASPIRSLVVMWLVACGLFMIVGIITPVDLRHLLAALPVIGMFAAFGFAGLWRSGSNGRLVAVAAAVWMAAVTAISWAGMLGGP
jgi:hypothetical protein